MWSPLPLQTSKRALLTALGDVAPLGVREPGADGRPQRGRLGQDPVEVRQEAADVDLGGDVVGGHAADGLGALRAGILEPAARIDAERGEGGLRLAAGAGRRLLEALLELAEDRGRDRVGAPLEAEPSPVSHRDGARGEGLARQPGGQREVEARHRLGPGTVEGPGDADVERPPQLWQPPQVEGEGEIDLAAVDRPPARERARQDPVGAAARPAAAAAAGGQRRGAGEHGEQREEARESCHRPSMDGGGGQAGRGYHRLGACRRGGSPRARAALRGAGGVRVARGCRAQAHRGERASAPRRRRRHHPGGPCGARGHLARRRGHLAHAEGHPPERAGRRAGQHPADGGSRRADRLPAARRLPHRRPQPRMVGLPPAPGLRAARELPGQPAGLAALPRPGHPDPDAGELRQGQRAVVHQAQRRPVPPAHRRAAGPGRRPRRRDRVRVLLPLRPGQPALGEQHLPGHRRPGAGARGGATGRPRLLRRRAPRSGDLPDAAARRCPGAHQRRRPLPDLQLRAEVPRRQRLRPVAGGALRRRHARRRRHRP